MYQYENELYGIELIFGCSVYGKCHCKQRVNLMRLRDAGQTATFGSGS